MTTNTMFNSYVFLFFSESFPNIWLLFIGMDWFKESRTIWQTISIMFKMLILTAYQFYYHKMIEYSDNDIQKGISCNFMYEKTHKLNYILHCTYIATYRLDRQRCIKLVGLYVSVAITSRGAIHSHHILDRCIL